MSQPASQLQPVNRVEILTLIDNYVDMLLPGNDSVIRPPIAPEGTVPPETLTAEHGLSLLITVHRNGQSSTVLLDAGHNSTALTHNASILGVEYDSIEAIVVSHGHMDHTGALKTVLGLVPPCTKLVIHPDAFLARYMDLPNGTRLTFPRTPSRDELQDLGADLVVESHPLSLADSCILVTGTVPRTTPFEQGLPNAYINRDGDLMKDSIEDDQALVIDLADRGLVVISGCAHSGIINSVRYAQELAGTSKICAVIGGFHLRDADDADVTDPTIEEMKKLSPEMVMPMHCTSPEVIQRFAREFPDEFVLSSVGTKLVL